MTWTRFQQKKNIKTCTVHTYSHRLRLLRTHTKDWLIKKLPISKLTAKDSRRSTYCSDLCCSFFLNYIIFLTIERDYIHKSWRTQTFCDLKTWRRWQHYFLRLTKYSPPKIPPLSKFWIIQMDNQRENSSLCVFTFIIKYPVIFIVRYYAG